MTDNLTDVPLNENKVTVNNSNRLDKSTGPRRDEYRVPIKPVLLLLVGSCVNISMFVYCHNIGQQVDWQKGLQARYTFDSNIVGLLFATYLTSMMSGADLLIYTISHISRISCISRISKNFSRIMQGSNVYIMCLRV